MSKAKPQRAVRTRDRDEGWLEAAEDLKEATPKEVRWFVLGVRALIGARGTTQAEVARALGGGAPYLSNVLSLDSEKTRKFRFNYACMLAAALESDLITVLKLGQTIEEGDRGRHEGESEI